MIILIIFSNYSYGKYFEKYILNYSTKIARPVFIVESDEMKEIQEFEDLEKEQYFFSIKNFDDTGVNQIKFSYYFELEGEQDEIEYELINQTTNQVINFENGKTNRFNIGLEKEIQEYCLSIDFSKSFIKENTKINLKIYADIYKE
ncbi:MAG: hypothetical protein J6J60_08980 [Clostridia bacterium]|nr:hypothetical protein [Clostridia bacterium]